MIIDYDSYPLTRCETVELKPADDTDYFGRIYHDGRSFTVKVACQPNDGEDPMIHVRVWLVSSVDEQTYDYAVAVEQRRLEDPVWEPLYVDPMDGETLFLEKIITDQINIAQVDGALLRAKYFIENHYDELLALTAKATNELDEPEAIESGFDALGIDLDTFF